MKVNLEVLKDFCIKLRGKTADEAIKGYKQPQNGEQTDEGTYRSDDLVDPGIVHGVTGTGGGPIISQ